MKLTDERIDQIVTAFANSYTDITPDLAKDLADVSENYNEIQIYDLYTARKEQADNEAPPEMLKG